MRLHWNVPSISTVWNSFIFRNWEGPVVYQEVDIIDLEAHSSRVILTYNHKWVIIIFAHSLLQPTTLHRETPATRLKWKAFHFCVMCYVRQLCGVKCLFFCIARLICDIYSPWQKVCKLFWFPSWSQSVTHFQCTVCWFLFNHNSCQFSFSSL